MKRIIRKIINKAGIDVSKYRVKVEPLGFLRHYDIQTVIDVGANIGQFAAEVRHALPKAHIYSFEPMKDCFAKLNDSRKKDSNFTSYNFALGDSAGSSVIHKNNYAPSSSLLENTAVLEEAFPFVKNSQDETILIKTLDSVLDISKLKKNILLKLDVQGYEEKVMRGGPKVLAESSFVLVEASFYELYEGQPLFADIFKYLSERGFDYHGGLQNKRHPKTGEILFEDSIFMKRGLKISK
jgi:FkbM family methyltransferase